MSEESSKPDPQKKPRRPRDANRLARLVVELATGSDDGVRANAEGEPTVEAHGSAGGKVGGKARAAKLTPEERSEIARKAAKARWEDKHD